MLPQAKSMSFLGSRLRNIGVNHHGYPNILSRSVYNSIHQPIGNSISKRSVHLLQATCGIGVVGCCYKIYRNTSNIPDSTYHAYEKIESVIGNLNRTMELEISGKI